MCSGLFIAITERGHESMNRFFIGVLDHRHLIPNLIFQSFRVFSVIQNQTAAFNGTPDLKEKLIALDRL